MAMIVGLLFAACGRDVSPAHTSASDLLAPDPRLAPWLGEWFAEGKLSVSLVDEGRSGVRIVPPAVADWSSRVEAASFDGATVSFELYFDSKTTEHPFSGVCNAMSLTIGKAPGTLNCRLDGESLGFRSDTIFVRGK